MITSHFAVCSAHLCAFRTTVRQMKSESGERKCWLNLVSGDDIVYFEKKTRSAGLCLFRYYTVSLFYWGRSNEIVPSHLTVWCNANSFPPSLPLCRFGDVTLCYYSFVLWCSYHQLSYGLGRDEWFLSRICYYYSWRAQNPSGGYPICSIFFGAVHFSTLW